MARAGRLGHREAIPASLLLACVSPSLSVSVCWFCAAGLVLWPSLDNVTSPDHNQVMSKVGIADLKAHLSQHLRKVRSGRTITVVDRDTPVAQIVPYGPEKALEVRRATRKPHELRLPPALPKPTDSLNVLLQDRASR